jgi:hypothetical protein
MTDYARSDWISLGVLSMRVLFLQCPSDKRAKLLDGSGENLLPRGPVLWKNPADANASTGSKGKAAPRVGNIINNTPKTPRGFAKVLTYDCLHRIVIPEGFRQSLHTPSPYVMTLKFNGACLWFVMMKTLDDGKAILEDGWPEFVIAHRLQIGYALTFKLVGPTTMKVIAFDLERIEIVSKCLVHPLPLMSRPESCVDVMVVCIW